MARINESELQHLKQAVSLVAIAQQQGREFDTLQLYKNGSPRAAVPYSYGGTGSDLEPFTEVYPQYGKGGMRQLIPTTQITIVARKIDILPEK